MNRIAILLRATCLLTAVCASGLALAQPSGQPSGQEPPRQGPPAESLAACKTLTSGAACSFTSPRGAETGTCFAPEGKPLACRPARGPKGEGGQGPNGGQPGPKPGN